MLLYFKYPYCVWGSNVPNILFTLTVRGSHATKSGPWNISKISWIGFLGKLHFPYQKEECKLICTFCHPFFLSSFLKYGPDAWKWNNCLWPWENKSQTFLRAKHQERRSLVTWGPFQSWNTIAKLFMLLNLLIIL